MKKQKNVRLRVDIGEEFKKISNILGLTQENALEIAVTEWVKKYGDEAQKKLDLYAERGIIINSPNIVNIAVFQRAEVLLAKEELTKLLGNLERGNPEYRKELQLDLARALKRIQPIYVKTKDPDLLQLLTVVEHQIEEKKDV